MVRIDPKFVELTADVLDFFLQYKIKHSFVELAASTD